MDPVYELFTRMRRRLVMPQVASGRQSIANAFRRRMSSEYQLFTPQGSGGFAVEAALVCARAHYRIVPLETEKCSGPFDMIPGHNPPGNGPVLRLENEAVLTDTTAILLYISCAYPGSQVAPVSGTIDHVKFLNWLIFLNTHVHQIMLRQAHPQYYTTDIASRLGVEESANRANEKAFFDIESKLQENEYLLGPLLSVADLYLAMLYAWNNDRLHLPRCEDLMRRVAEQEAIVPIWCKYFADRPRTD